MLIKFQMEYANAAAISRDPNEPDEIKIYFDKKYFSDPRSNIEINSGENLVASLPRQINAAEAE